VFDRLEELEEVSGLLKENRLVTIVGAGGVGKSTLAKALLDTADDPTMFVELEGLQTDGLEEGLAGGLGFGSWKELNEWLSPRRVILAMDNCEHVVGSVGEMLTGLLRDCASLTVLAVSREPLNVEGERVFILNPMSLQGRPSPAAELFEHFVEARGLQPSDGEADVEALCASLDGLPLALELAAGRMTSMTAREIRESVETRLDLLTRSRPRRTDRESSLAATIQWSFDLLDREDRDYLARLSVFGGPFDARLAAAVGGSTPGAATVKLHEMIDKSLLIHDSAAGRSTYRMLNTVRTHCRQRLERSGRSDDSTARMVDALVDRYARLVEPAEHMGDLTVIDDVKRDYLNLKAALSWCLEDDPEPNRVGILLLAVFWLEEIGHHADMAEVISAVPERWPGANEVNAMSWGIRANFAQLSGRSEEARLLAQRSLGADGGPFSIFCSRRVLGILDRRDRDYERAIDHFRRGAGELRREGWEPHARELEAHSCLARFASGDEQAAVSRLAELEIATRAFPLCHRTVELFHIHLLLRSEPEEAALRAQPILEQSRNLGHRWAAGTSAYVISAAAVLRGEKRAATAPLAEALRAYEEARTKAEMHHALLVAAALLDDLGDPDAAAQARVGAGRGSELSDGDPISHVLRLEVDSEALGRASGDFRTDRISAALMRAARSPSTESSSAAGPPDRFVRQGDFWELEYLGRRSLVKDSKGMRDLARLVSVPGHEISALDLMEAEVVQNSTGPLIDRRARAAYEERIRELQAEVDDAEIANDPARAARATAELEALLEQLMHAHGLGGKTRGSGDTAERARSAVTWRIRAAIDRISAEDPDLGDHLQRSVRTGRFCAYEPHPEVSWQV
jgi:predicted ATPase